MIEFLRVRRDGEAARVRKSPGSTDSLSRVAASVAHKHPQVPR